MERKAIMGVAAVAGIGLLLYLRKTGDSASIAGAGSLVGAASGASNWAAQPIIINTKAPPVVADATAQSPAPAPAPAPVQTADWSFGGTASTPSSSSGGHLGNDGYYYHADGSRSYVQDTLDVQAVWGGTRLA